jgi:serine/threonine protein kinase
MPFVTAPFSSERYAIGERIGEGGMGVVYRASDVRTGAPVALKTVTHMDPTALLRFKNEWRALADISHPNVVQLYELVSERGVWFFTMELVDGVDFLRFVRRIGRTAYTGTSARGLATEPTSEPTLMASDLSALVQAEVARGLTGASGRCCDVGRLRAALPGLVAGVSAIHAAGKLHRDIKPSNVMVDGGGRVVLLDFGVVSDVSSHDERRLEDNMFGTPAYMAPEQAVGGPVTSATDLYSLGVMLYEALADRLPFEGPPREVLLAKQTQTPPPPSSFAAGVPEDLEQLTLALLAPDPRARPPASWLIERLSSAESTRAHTITGSTRLGFVGRAAELAALDDALSASRERARVALVSGESGMGKSALMQEFLARARERGALTFAGRCYERESVPFKGMDSLLDDLGRYLMYLGRAQVRALLSDDVGLLARMFPVLNGVQRVPELAPSDYQSIEPLELRRRAFLALRELLSKLASEHPVVLHVDDVQWSDVDSVAMLAALLAEPNAPRVLWVLSRRAETSSRSPVTSALDELLNERVRADGCVEIELGPLSAAEALQLARQSLDADGSADPALLAALAGESQGMPYFLAELLEHQRHGRARAGSAPNVALEELLGLRIAELPAAARALLEVFCVAGAPIAHDLAVRVAVGRSGLEPRDAANARELLRAARFLRSQTSDVEERAEAYHAKIRECVVRSLPGAELASLNGALARALEPDGRADPELLVEHFLAAQDNDGARRHALRAADSAFASLAFLRAARLYELCLRIEVDAPRRELETKRGDALASAGHGLDAALAYLAAADLSSGVTAVDLKRRAAEHLLKSGHEEFGLRVLRDVLDALGIGYPASTGAALARLLLGRAKLRLRSIAFSPRRVDECDPTALARIDATFAATVGLALLDVVRSADFSARHLSLALETGEPLRVSRALTLEAGNLAAVSPKGRERAELFVRKAEEIASRREDPNGVALSLIGSGLVRVFSGEWRGAQRVLDQAAQILRERCRAVAWELTQAECWAMNSLILCGELKEAARRVPAAFRDAHDRDDRFALMQLVYSTCITHIAAGDVERALEIASDERRFGGAADRFTGGHWGVLVSTVSARRYRNEGRSGWEYLSTQWRRLEESHFLRVQLMRVCSVFERALTAVAAAEDGGDVKALLSDAERSARRLAGERVGYATGMGGLIAASVAAARGSRDQARSALVRAHRDLVEADLGYLARCAAVRLGRLEGGEYGQNLARIATEELFAEGVVDLESCLAMSSPGFARLS